MKILIVTPHVSYDYFGETDNFHSFIAGIKTYDASTQEKLAIAWCKILKKLEILSDVLEYEGLGIVQGKKPKMPQISLKDAADPEKVAKLTEEYEKKLAEYNRLDAEENAVLEIIQRIEDTPLEDLNESFDIASKIGDLTLEEFIKHMKNIADRSISYEDLPFYSYGELQ